MYNYKELLKKIEDKFKTATEMMHTEKGRLCYDVYTEVYQLLKEYEFAIKSIRPLLVEDGSVDIDQLEEDGFYVITYRQGSTPPMWLPNQHEDKGE